MKGKIKFSFKPPTQFDGDPEVIAWYNECAKRVQSYRDKHRLKPASQAVPSEKKP